MQKIKSKITEITSFNKLYGFCTLLTVIWFAMTIGVFYFCIIKWLGMPFAETGYSGWKDLSDYSYSVCAIAATIAVVSHTTLTVLISTSKNKTFGIELKEFLRNCKWRLRPFTTFGVSILTVLWCVAIAVCERPDFLMLLLVWLIIYIGCYSLMVWKLSINVGFAADFFRKFFKKTKQTELLKEREQVVSKIFSQLSGLDEGEQKYGIAIIAELVQNSNKEVWDFYKQELENTFHKQIEENENFDLENNIFRNLCELLVCDNFSYCTLLINTYSAVKGASDHNANYAEIDVQLSSDGIPVVIHDNDLSRLANERKNVSNLTAKELTKLTVYQGNYQDKIPTLDGLIKKMKKNDIDVDLLIELKTENSDSQKLAKEIIKVVEKNNFEDRSIFMSLDYDAVTYLQQEHPEWWIGYCIYGSAGDLDESLWNMDIDFLAIEENRATLSFIEKANNNWVPVYVWTVDTSDKMRQYLDMGVSGIITNYPDRGKAAVDDYLKHNYQYYYYKGDSYPAF